MGFLRKGLKFVKKQIKKVGKVVKKVFKKIKKSKILKAIALVGAAIVTGGAFVGAYGGTMASSTVGSWLASTSANILATPVVGTLATPFKWLGSAAGNVAAGVFPPAAATPATPPPAASSGTPSTGSFFGHKTPNIIKGVEDVLKSEFVQDVGKGVLGGVATGYIMNELTEEDPVGAYGSGLGEERGLELTPLEIAYSQANININDAYKNLTYGNADTSFLYNTSEFAKSPMIGVA